jgi:predicted amidohydrolase
VSLTTVACCQAALAVGDGEGNRARVAAAVHAAAARGADVVVVPELANSGYVFRDAAEAESLAEPVTGPTVTGWAELARRLGVVLVGGFCERGAGALYNSAVLVDPTGVCAVYRKAHLWNCEKLVFTPGEAAPPVVETHVGRIGVLVCYDLEVPEWVRLPALAGADLLCAPVNWPAFPRPEGERPAEVVRVQAAAAVNRMFVAACDRAGAERGVDWVSASVVVDPDGWPLALSTQREDVVLATCRLADARNKRISEHNDVHADRRPKLYSRFRDGGER